MPFPPASPQWHTGHSAIFFFLQDIPITAAPPPPSLKKKTKNSFTLSANVQKTTQLTKQQLVEKKKAQEW